MAQLRYWRPVLVVTDMVMPNKEGLELVDYVNENYPDTPVITISGGYRASAKNLEMSRSLGANISLQKPFSIMDLVDAVSGLMHAR
jgi:DNA-binding NtrC family response regulator